MIIINTLFVLIWCIEVNTHYTFYYSDIHQGSYPTFDCLYAHLVEAGKESGKSYLRNYHLIPYCRRPDNHEQQTEVLYPINENIAKSISFKELKRQNVTSEQLLEWFSPIDIAEKYQMNINDSDVFHNCSSPWFGSMCQYKLHYDLPLSFGDIVQIIFHDQYEILSNVSSGTCYKFLSSCSRGLWPLCLDWREICDGKFDCMNGEDEDKCDELEWTECNVNEYRCHYGGQCIPLSFAKDSRLSIDCLDGSDEQDQYMRPIGIINALCLVVSTFRCQERIGRYPGSFQCGDGQYLTRALIPRYHTYCSNQKENKLSRAMVTSMDHISNINCGKAFYCALHFNRTFGLNPGNITISRPTPIIEDIWDKDCEPLSKHCSSEWLVIPAYPILFGFFQFVYFTNRSIDEFKENVIPDYICFNPQACPTLLEKIVPIQLNNGLTCFHSSNLINALAIKDFNGIMNSFEDIDQLCLKRSTEKSCKNSSYFYCNESMKCISYHRVGDGRNDCYHGEDESFNACQLNDSNRFKCQSDLNKCLLPVAHGDGYPGCPSNEDEVFVYAHNFATLVLFPDLCNHRGNSKQFSLITNETAQTNCDWWPCHNSYTHCDQYWDCQNGADELNCPHTKCSSNEHQCENQQLELSYCIPSTHIYEKYLDPCRDLHLFRQFYYYNGTDDISQHYLSWNNNKCVTIEKLCRIDHHLQTSLAQDKVCFYGSNTFNVIDKSSVILLQNNESLCDIKSPQSTRSDGYFFTASKLGYFPTISMNLSIPTISKTNQKEMNVSDINAELVSYCHRGILVLHGLNETKICLCPPNYFGSRCQWQNQRISLTIQLLWRSTVSTNVIFQLIIMLIDQHGQIADNHEQLTYMPTRDCDTKFNIYLLYPQRPKSLSNNYSIRIQIYEKIKLDYWASWYIPIPFQFLPVNRIATQLIIPETQETKSCILSCGKHGKCIRYTNNKSLSFCQCDQGHSGSQCQNKHKCNCSNDSFCLDPPICICPLHKFGSFCHLTHSICQFTNNPCENNGFCVPTDHRIDLKGFTCFCPNDYSGERCQNKNNRIDIHLDPAVVSTTSLLLFHFITAFKDAEHERITILKKIPYNQNSLTIYVTQPFNILFVQIPDKHYYLTIVREIFIPSEYIYTEIHSKQRCSSIDDLLNNTYLQYEYLRRVKYYPLLCRQHSELKCFYDKDLMCLCDLDRFSNCFLFDHTMNNNCQGSNYCQNGGDCFQNNASCPTRLTCICPDCYYGTKCQFSTAGFMFSLDSILAYHVKPNVSINHQPLIIKISITISTILLVLGLINGILSIVTFRRIKPRQVGTGYYLLFSSIVSIIIIILLTIKFWILISAQILLINNRSFLKINCLLLDVSLKIVLASSEWLNACVATERMFSVIKATRFDKKKSKKVSKWVILSIFIMTILTHIHDPIRRELIDDYDIDEHRIWCFVRYSPSMNIYNSFITLFHLLIPFSVNIISALWIIITIAYNRSGIQSDETFGERLKQQLKQHRNILYSPFMLIILTLPRVIISFVNGCMRSSREPWLYLIGYFISFIPSMLTFTVFVLPSTNYKSEFNTVVEQTMKKFRTNS